MKSNKIKMLQWAREDNNYNLLPPWGNSGEIWGQTAQSKGFTKLLLSDVVLCSHITTNVHLSSALLVLLVQRTKWHEALNQTYKGSCLKYSHLLTSSSSKFIRARYVGRWSEGMGFPTSPLRLDLTACLTEPHIKPSSTSFNLTSTWGIRMWYTIQVLSMWVCLLFQINMTA